MALLNTPRKDRLYRPLSNQIATERLKNIDNELLVNACVTGCEPCLSYKDSALSKHAWVVDSSLISRREDPAECKDPNVRTLPRVLEENEWDAEAAGTDLTVKTRIPPYKTFQMRPQGNARPLILLHYPLSTYQLGVKGTKEKKSRLYAFKNGAKQSPQVSSPAI